MEEVEAPGSMALSVESCAWSRVGWGLVRTGGGGVTASAAVAEETDVVPVAMGEMAVVQVESVRALLFTDVGGL